MNAPTIKRYDEPSAWLRGAVADALASNQMLREMLRHPRRGVVLSRLMRYAGDRECDRCGLDVPEGQDFYPFLFPAEGGRVVFVVGLCPRHALAEGEAL